MNKFIKAVTEFDVVTVRVMLGDPAWRNWHEKTGKNALHYVCGVPVGDDPRKAKVSVEIVKLLLENGLDINSIHKIPSGNDFFPGTPLWYAYTRGRNQKVYRHLLKLEADPEHCMFAITWNDEVNAANLFLKHGATIDHESGGYTPFLSSVYWKRFKMMKWFLEKGVDPDFADPKGNTALYYAVKRKYDAAVIKLLLKFGADFNKRNKNGVSPRILAEQNRQRSVLELFGTKSR